MNRKNIWTDIKEAIAGTERDFTTTRVSKAMFILAIPMVLEMLMESVFAVVDIFFVSRLGSDAIATVGITEAVVTIVYAIGIGLSIATTALISRRIGEKKPKDAGEVAFQAIIVGFFASFLIAIPGVLFAKPFLEIMGLDSAFIDDNFWYPAIMFGGNGVIMLLFIMNAVFRSSGDAAMSFRVLLLANGINIILDPTLMFGWGPFPELGIKGAAIATNIGRGTAVIFQLYILFKGNKRIKLFRENIRLNVKVMWNLLKLSAGGILQNLIAMSSWVLLVRIISELGTDSIAGYTIAIRVVIFTILPAWGLSNAAATLVGQNLGANSPERAERAVWMASKINMVLMGLIGAVLVIFPEFFIQIFIKELSVLEKGVLSLRIIGFGYVAYSFGMVLIQSFNGSGDTKTPTWINLFCFWLFEIPLAYLLAIVMDLGLAGACISIVSAETLLAIVGFILFRKGKWKTVKV